MRKIAALLLAVLVLFTANSAPANAAANSPAQQQTLNALLSNFGIVLGASTSNTADDYGTGVTSAAGIYCPKLTGTFQRGARDATTGGQVTELQLFLADYFNIDEETLVSGYFGRLTQSYVIRFQQAKGLPSVGIVGSLTRAAIAAACGPDAVSPGTSVTPTTQPVTPTVTTTGKCGINTYRVQDSCGGDSYRSMYVQCQDGHEETQGGSTSCKPASVWEGYAQTACTNRCSLTPVEPSLSVTSALPANGSVDVQLILPQSYSGDFVVYLVNPVSVSQPVSSGSLLGLNYYFSGTNNGVFGAHLGLSQAHEGFATNPGGVHWFPLPSGKYRITAVVYPSSPFKPGTDMEYLPIASQPAALKIIDSASFDLVNLPPPGSSALSATLDASSPGVQFAAGGATDVTLGVFKISATGNEQVDVSQISIAADTYNFSPVDLTSITVWNGLTQIGSGFFTPSIALPLGYYTDIPLLGTLPIPANGSQVITVKGNFAQIGTGQPGTSGHKVQVEPFDLLGNASVSRAMVEKDYRSGGAPVSAPTYLYKSFPKIALDTSLPTSGLTDGRLVRFKIAADGHGPVGIAQIGFNFQGLPASTNGQADLYAYSDSNYSMPVGGFSANGAINGLPVTAASPGGYLWFPQPLEIPAGQTRYFELRDSTKGSGLTNTFALTTKILGQDAFAGVVSATSLQGKDAAFVWSPNSRTTSQFSDVDWTNGYSVSGLPAGGLIFTRTTDTSLATPTVQIAASPGTVPAGQSATLAWSSVNANRCVLQYGSSEEQIGVSGTKTVTPAVTTSYKIICVNVPGNGKDGPSAQATVTVAVTGGVQTPSCTITANKTAVASGEQFTLSWTTTNIAQPVMYQQVKGGGTVAVSPSGSMTWTAETNTGTTATNDVFQIGGGGISAPYLPICSVTVSIAPQTTLAQPVISSFSASPASVSSKQASQLSWNSTNATRCVLQYGGVEYPVATSGTRSVTVTATTDYTLICTNDPGTGKDGPSATAHVTIYYYYPTTTVRPPTSPLP